MYKNASQGRQYSLRRAVLPDAMGSTSADNVLPDAERIIVLRRALRKLDAEINISKGRRRKELGLLKQSLSVEVRAIDLRLKPTKVKARSAHQHFIDVVREAVSTHVFNIYWVEATRRSDKERADLNVAERPSSNQATSPLDTTQASAVATGISPDKS